MKKFMTIFGAALFVFALTSCGDATTQDTEGTDDVSTEESTDVTVESTEESTDVAVEETEAEVVE